MYGYGLNRIIDTYTGTGHHESRMDSQRKMNKLNRLEINSISLSFPFMQSWHVCGYLHAWPLTTKLDLNPFLLYVSNGPCLKGEGGEKVLGGERVIQKSSFKINLYI